MSDAMMMVRICRITSSVF